MKYLVDFYTSLNTTDLVLFWTIVFIVLLLFECFRFHFRVHLAYSQLMYQSLFDDKMTQIDDKMTQIGLSRLNLNREGCALYGMIYLLAGMKKTCERINFPIFNI